MSGTGALGCCLAPRGPDGQVPVEDYELPIGQAEIVQEGTDDSWPQLLQCLSSQASAKLLAVWFFSCGQLFQVTLLGWGSQIGRLQAVSHECVFVKSQGGQGGRS